LNFENHQYYNCEVTLDTGERYNISANWMHNNDLDNFQGWECSAGQYRISIDKDLTVWSAQCENQKLGHALDGFDILSSPGICQQNRCTGCTDDLLTKKLKATKQD
jgi:hypothetical protein